MGQVALSSLACLTVVLDHPPVNLTNLDSIPRQLGFVFYNDIGMKTTGPFHLPSAWELSYQDYLGAYKSRDSVCSQKSVEVVGRIRGYSEDSSRWGVQGAICAKQRP